MNNDHLNPTASMPLVMGIVNVTSDSFSDGAQFLNADAAIAHGLQLVNEGADIVDVGAESTRPGATPIDEATELTRAIPVVAALAPHVRVSIDTTKPAVARAAVEAGASLINDVSASLASIAAEMGVGWVAMHSRGTPATMQSLTEYHNVVVEVKEFLAAKANEAVALGVSEIWIDPGIGFAKNAQQNIELLANLEAFCELGWPVLVGTSRKRFLGEFLALSDERGENRGARAKGKGGSWYFDDKVLSVGSESSSTKLVDVSDRLEGSIATATWALAKGARMVRVHDVRASVEVLSVIAGSINEL